MLHAARCTLHAAWALQIDCILIPGDDALEYLRRCRTHDRPFRSLSFALSAHFLLRRNAINNAINNAFRSVNLTSTAALLRHFYQAGRRRSATCGTQVVALRARLHRFPHAAAAGTAARYVIARRVLNIRI